MRILCFLFVIFLYVLETSNALNEKCINNTDCPIKERSVCVTNTCQCDILSNYSEAQGKCLNYATEFNALCFEDWQCSDFVGDNSKCINNACLCQKGYRWYQGKCQKYAQKDESCGDEVICLDLSNPLALTCNGGVCQCSDGYYDRGGDCRLKSGLDGECAITSDCFPTDNWLGILTESHCELGKCVENNSKLKSDTSKFNNTFNYVSSRSYLKTIMDESLDEVLAKIKETSCPNGVSSDLSEDECKACPNTILFRNTCICDRGFFLRDGQCIPELGMKDPNTQYTNSTCPIKPGKADVDGICYCKDYWFQDSTNRECKKTTLEYTRNCLDNDWCKAMGTYAYCDSETSKCKCSSLAVLNETSFYCEPKPDANFSLVCLEASACPLYETCTNEKCQCNQGFFRINETSLCLPEIGASCEVRDCDHIDNAICSTKETCQCKSNEYVTDGLQCLPQATKLYETCHIQQQCQTLPNTDCLQPVSDNTTSQCLCIDEYFDYEGTCYAIKTPGSQCTTRFNCTVILGDTFECRNSLCQCPIGKTLNSDNICVSSAHRSAAALPLLLSVVVFLKYKFE